MKTISTTALLAASVFAIISQPALAHDEFDDLIESIPVAPGIADNGLDYPFEVNISEEDIRRLTEDNSVYISGDFGGMIYQNTNALGGGTVVSGPGGPGNEVFAGTLDQRIFAAAIRYSSYIPITDEALDDTGSGGVKGIYVDGSGSMGHSSYSGSAEVGVNDVTSVGLTYLEPDTTYGTGVIAVSSGYGVTADGVIGNTSGRLDLGVRLDLGHILQTDGPEVRGLYGPDSSPHPGTPQVTANLSFFYEGSSTEASGHADITLGGAAFPGYYQDYNLEIQDQTFGVHIGPQFEFSLLPDGNLEISLGAGVDLGVRTSIGAFSQETGVGGGATIVQQRNYTTTEFALGAGLEASANYIFGDGWSARVTGGWSLTPVTGFSAPQNPSEQAGAGFSSQFAQQLTGSLGVLKSL